MLSIINAEMIQQVLGLRLNTMSHMVGAMKAHQPEMPDDGCFYESLLDVRDAVVAYAII